MKIIQDCAVNEWNHQAFFASPPIEEGVADRTSDKGQEEVSAAAASDDPKQSKESLPATEARWEEAPAE